jgi:ABC-type phosphate/phosphonate transport system substrate-binding protein
MTGPASLPMYDWPEVQPATDALWAALRDALRAEGLPAPDALTRDLPLETVWRHPRLALSMTCGLPLVSGLAGDATLLGAFDYGLPDTPPGCYRSAVVIRTDDPRDGLEAFRGATLAFNSRDSQSGFGAILHHVAPLASEGRFFAAAIETGAHAASAPAVAEGRADIAAIDAVSWRLVQRFRPEAAALRVLMLSDPTPGLPVIAAPGTDAGPARRAVIAALAALDPAIRAQLGLAGFVPLDRDDYRVVADRIAAARPALRRDATATPPRRWIKPV